MVMVVHGTVVILVWGLCKEQIPNPPYVTQPVGYGGHSLLCGMQVRNTPLTWIISQGSTTLNSTSKCVMKNETLACLMLLLCFCCYCYFLASEFGGISFMLSVFFPCQGERRVGPFHMRKARSHSVGIPQRQPVHINLIVVITSLRIANITRTCFLCRFWDHY